jgi:hypothetical protein
MSLSLLCSVASWYGRVVRTDAPVLTLAISSRNSSNYLPLAARLVWVRSTAASRRTNGRYPHSDFSGKIYGFFVAS